jgi:UDP-N-acetylmuramate dehydrogenase
MTAHMTTPMNPVNSENSANSAGPATAATSAALGEALRPYLGTAGMRLDEPLGPYTTFRIGGPADVLYDATSADELASAITAARALGIPWFVLGLGANILVGDRGVRGLVIRNVASHHRLGSDGSLWSESGAIVGDLVLETVRNGWSGLEHYIGIPSTVGGALWQNLHFLSPAPERARTMFISEVFESCEILGEDGVRREVDADYINFGYDDTIFHHRRDTVLSARFRLTPADPFDLHRILQENLAWRGSRHPWLGIHPSAGSVFKKIEGVGAGRLIDQCGLKGFRVGDAAISHIHANILVNLGNATAADVRALIAHAQAAVEQRFGHRLEPEIGFIGEF